MRSRCASEYGGIDDLDELNVSFVAFHYLAQVPQSLLCVQSNSGAGGVGRTAASAQRVRLVVALSEAGSSLRCGLQSVLKCGRYGRLEGCGVLIVNQEL